MSDEIQKAAPGDRNWGAKAGQTIAGRLTRGNDGKFSAGGSGPAPKRKPARGKGSARTRAAAAAKAKAEAERKAKAEQKAAEKAAKEAERKAKAEQKAAAAAKAAAEKAKKGKGGGGGKGKKDDPAAKDKAKQEAEAQKAAQRLLEQQQRQSAQQQAQAQRQSAQAAQQAARQQAQAAQRRQTQQTQAQRQAAQQADRDQRRSQMDAERAGRQQKADARRAAIDARRDRLDAARAARQQASDARRDRLDAARAKRQAAADARRDRLDAERAKRQPATDGKAKAGTPAPGPAPQAPRPGPQKPAPAPAPAPPAKPAPSSPLPTGSGPRPDGPMKPPAPAPNKPRRDRRRSRLPRGPVVQTMTKALAPSLDYHGFFAIAKRDDEQRIVEGIASTEQLDDQGGVWKSQFYDGDLVDPQALTTALPDYMAWANLREMHQPSAVGTVLKAWIADGALHIVAKIVDDTAWQKVVEGVYKGFSIGGKCLDAVLQKLGDKIARRITALKLTEISLVDRPANPDARITLWKGADIMDPTEEVAKAAGGDPQKAIASLQQLRDAAELAGDLVAADHYSAAIALTLEGAGIAAPHEEPDGDEALVDHDEAGDETDLDMADGMDLAAMPEDQAVVAMAAKIGDIAKAGRTISTSNMAHLTAIHDAIQKMSGGTVCKGALPEAPAAPAAEPPIAMSARADDIQKTIADALAPLQRELEALKAQPAPGGPLQRPVPIEKRLPDQADPPPAKPAPQLRDRAELQRLAMTEPNPALRADYQRQLSAIDGR